MLTAVSMKGPGCKMSFAGCRNMSWARRTSRIFFGKMVSHRKVNANQTDIKPTQGGMQPTSQLCHVSCISLCQYVLLRMLTVSRDENVIVNESGSEKQILLKTSENTSSALSDTYSNHEVFISLDIYQIMCLLYNYISCYWLVIASL